MKTPFSLEQISRTGTHDANLVLRQQKLELTARFMAIKTINPKRNKKK